MTTKADEQKQADTEECNPCDQQDKVSKSDLDTATQNKEKSDDNNEVDVRRGFFAKRRNNTTEVRPPQSQRQKVNTLNKNPDVVTELRPAFFSGLHGHTTSNTKLQPRAVAIPYSRFRKERFYDWPPDPTVSRATPIVLHLDNTENDDSLSASIPDRPESDHEEDDLLDASLREHRKCSDRRSSSIPEYVTF